MVAVMNFRKGWALYLVLYSIVFLLSLYPYFRLGGRFQLLSLLSALIDVCAIVALCRHVLYMPIPSLLMRLLAIALAAVYVLRLLFVGWLLLSNLFPWSGGAEQWPSVVGLSAASVQLPMVLALFLYALGMQARATRNK